VTAPAIQETQLCVQAALDSSPPGWDEFYADCAHVHPYQSAAFGEWERLRGHQVAYVSIASMADPGEKVGQCLVTIDPRRIATWYFGPVLHDTAAGRLECATAALLGYLRGHGVIAVENARTPVRYGGEPASCAPLDGRLHETPVIDLTQPEETLQRSFDRAVRKNWRKCRERHVQFCLSEGDPEALESYVTILGERRRKLGFSMPPFYPNHDSARCFAERGKTARLFVALARVEGIPMAGLGFAVFRRVAVEVGVAQSAGYAALQLPLHDFIKVEACRELARLGVEIYDLGGVSTRPRSRKEENIRRFKQKFSSRMASYQSIDVRFEPARYYYFRGLAKIERLCQKVSSF
jgi:hypothetical protein